jgi:hypothetical protein
VSQWPGLVDLRKGRAAYRKHQSHAVCVTRSHTSSFSQLDAHGVPVDEPNFLKCFEEFFNKAASKTK